MATILRGRLATWWEDAPGGVNAALWTLLAIVTLTYLTSTARGSWAVRNKTAGSKPPVLPYTFPLLGHLPEFLWDTSKFLSKATARYGASVPVRIQLLNRRINLLKGPENVVGLFKGSRDLSSEHWLVQVLVNAFGVEVADTPFYLADNTGISNQPDKESVGVRPEHRIFYLVYKSVHDGLSGARLAEMERQLVRNLSAGIADAGFSSDAWTEVPDVYGSFIRSICFRAAIVSLCGQHVFSVCPTFEDDFWDFDSHLPSLFKEIPSWLAPSAYKARNKMKDNMKQWHAFVHQYYDVSGGSADKRDWEEYFGSRLMRTRHEFFQKMPLSKETLAADDLGLVWAATANAIPGIGWMLLEILQDPSLLASVRQEIAPFVSRDPSNPDRLVVDIDNLCNGTLVQSIYAEVLRVHNGTVISRIPRTANFTIGGWHFGKGDPVMVSTYNTAREPSVWNQGSVEDPHPLDTFWSQRFIVDPEKPGSGPVLSQGTVAQHLTSNSGSSETRAKPQFSMAGTDGSWVPYGGGSRMCPGRHFAKRELIATMAMFVTAFDIELSKDIDTPIKHDMSYFMFGVMHPKGNIPARIRKRAF